MNYKYDVYTCCSRKDIEKVKTICEMLAAAGISYVLRCVEFSVAPQRIRESNLFLFIGSENTAASSYYVRRILSLVFETKSSNHVLAFLIDDSYKTASLVTTMENFSIRCIDSNTSCADFITIVRNTIKNTVSNTVRKPSVCGAPPQPTAYVTKDYKQSSSVPLSEPREFSHHTGTSAVFDDAVREGMLTSYEPCYERAVGESQYESNSGCQVPSAAQENKLLSLWSRFFKRKQKFHRMNDSKPDTVYSTIYAPAEIKKGYHFVIQVYLHQYEQQDQIAAVAKEVQEDAVRRGSSKMLAYPLKRGDRVDISVRLCAEKELLYQKKSVVWMGQLTQCNFNCMIAKDLEANEIFCEAVLSVNGIPMGDMSFITRIVMEPRRLHPEVLSRRYQKIFMSYAHQDIEKVRPYAHAYKVEGREYFFDRHSLEIGDVYEEKILDYINTSDLFLLFWSEHAAVSDYVKKEFLAALKRAYPQVPFNDAQLRICPMSIEPHADLPVELKNIYNFEKI